MFFAHRGLKTSAPAVSLGVHMLTSHAPDVSGSNSHPYLECSGSKVGGDEDQKRVGHILLLKLPDKTIMSHLIEGLCNVQEHNPGVLVLVECNFRIIDDKQKLVVGGIIPLEPGLDCRQKFQIMGDLLQPVQDFHI